MEATPEVYGKGFFTEREALARRSAQEIVPLVVDMLQPHSVVDVGCANGIWLDEFRRNGVSTVLGVDGDYALAAELFIPRERFIACDLARRDPDIHDTFDIAVSAEVAEHLPAARAASFVRLLCRLSPTVVFSAAIPFQGGVNHLNEQWPEYWERLFEAEGYIQLDLLRPTLWTKHDVAFWYRQNLFVYLSPQRYAMLPPEIARLGRPSEKLHLVHERIIRELDGECRRLRQERERPGLQQCLQQIARLPMLTAKAARRRLSAGQRTNSLASARIP